MKEFSDSQQIELRSVNGALVLPEFESISTHNTSPIDRSACKITLSMVDDRPLTSMPQRCIAIQTCHQYSPRGTASSLSLNLNLSPHPGYFPRGHHLLLSFQSLRIVSETTVACSRMQALTAVSATFSLGMDSHGWLYVI